MVKNIYLIIKFICNHPITKDFKFKAIINFIRWQIAARLLRKKIIIPWVDDSTFILGIGQTGLSGNLYTGFMEYEDMLFLLHALNSEEIFVDVGANVGAYTILASKVVGARSISFEPLPDTVERLKDQIQINRLNNLVSIRNIGLSNKGEELFFTTNNDTMNQVCLDGHNQNLVKIEVSTLDIELDINQKYFLKIDVEGFEYFVIDGGKGVLSSPNTIALIIELNGSGVNFGYTNNDIHEELINYGFIPVAYDPLSREIRKLNTFNQNNGNTIYVKDIKLIESRCKLAPKYYLHTPLGSYI
jgi:FkbM family methyltransferase